MFVNPVRVDESESFIKSINSADVGNVPVDTVPVSSLHVPLAHDFSRRILSISMLLPSWEFVATIFKPEILASAVNPPLIVTGKHGEN